LFQLLTEAEAKNALYEEYIKKEKEQDEREQLLAKRELEVEKAFVKIAQAERDIAIEQAKHYENLYKQITKKRGIGCTLKRIFTLGFARC
jgi:hypothetical protein